MPPPTVLSPVSLILMVTLRGSLAITLCRWKDLHLLQARPSWGEVGGRRRRPRGGSCEQDSGVHDPGSATPRLSNWIF